MTATPKIRPGRPRLLTRDRIVEAALRLGLTEFSMKAVAAELGTTIATLYKYVRDRDHLFRLAVDEALARMPLPTDHGQHWSVFLSEFADVVCGALIADRQVLGRVIDWGVGMETELKLDEIFLRAMTRRGFAVEEASRILRLTGAAAFGVAVRTHCNRARISRSGSLQRALEEAMSPFVQDKLPEIPTIPSQIFDDGLSLLHDTLAPLIEQIARSRGETLPRIAAPHAPAP
jgi:AcrR family transcriptional regulator